MNMAVSIAIALCLGLVGCGNDDDSFAMARVVKSGVTERLPGTSGAKAPEVSLTRATLAQILTPVQMVTRERTGQKAIIANVAVNQGVETWSTVDKVTISLRQGVLVATRGFGEDLMAADGPGPDVLTRSNSGHARGHTLLNGLDQPVRTIYDCKIAQIRRQTIVVVELSYDTTQVTETCSGAGRTLQNEFWFDGSGRIRKSRQWVSSGVGHLIVEDLRH